MTVNCTIPCSCRNPDPGGFRNFLESPFCWGGLIGGPERLARLRGIGHGQPSAPAATANATE